ncbi:MAG: IS481 family transposase [Actinomycetota bacterium]|nr:IS481 family transposase [Actinomycetota bacterium]
MSHDDLIIHHRVQLFKYAKRHNVKAACQIFGISRTRYYELLKDFKKYGRLGLAPKKRPKPKMPNQIKKEVEKEILDYVREYPTHGPERIANELKRKTFGRISYSGGGTYNVLKRNGLNRRFERLLYAEEHGNGIFTELLQRELERRKENHVETHYPGELLSMDVKLVGRIKGIGKIYHQVAVDCDSSFGFAKLYLSKKAKTSCDFLESSVLPIYEAFSIPLLRVLTDNGKEYTALSKRGKKIHIFEKALRKYGIRHSYTKLKHPWTNGYAESFHKTLLNDFYQLAFRKKIYTSLEELQKDLDEFLHHYNFKRTHQGWKLNGKTPAEKFLNGKRCPALESPKIKFSKNNENRKCQKCQKVST